jgi:hypothetical protein
MVRWTSGEIGGEDCGDSLKVYPKMAFESRLLLKNQARNRCAVKFAAKLAVLCL